MSTSPGSQRLDAGPELLDLNLPYDVQTKGLSGKPRLVAGSNMWVDLTGALSKRPAIRDSDVGTMTVPATHRLERIWVYKTLETPAKVYILGSWKNTSTNKYKMFYARVGTTAAWTTCGTLREVDNSDRQHEVVVANGKAYIKAYPANATSEFLGTTVFDGTDASLHFWGLLGPTQAQAATLSASSGWGASDNTMNVSFGWKYSYSWKTSTGQFSSRAPIKDPSGQQETSASDSGAFVSKLPEVTVQGDADTTNIPSIQIWRTNEGGGVFQALELITNTGSGNKAYVDKNHSSGADDPVPDNGLNKFVLAPFSTVNDPPPSVISPEVVGVNEVDPTSNLVEYAGRIWYAIGNILVFSGNEEIASGIPQESFPSGLTGNFVRFKNPIRKLAATSEALYIMTDETILWMTGSRRRGQGAFHIRPLFDKVGAAEGNNAGVASIRDFVCFVTDSYEIGLIQGRSFKIISGPLKDEIKGAISATTEVQIAGHFFEGSGWVAVGLRDTSDSTNSRIWIYDLARGAWNPPWVIPFSAMTSGRVRESDQTRELIVATEDATGARCGVLDFAAFTDQFAAGNVNYAPTITTNLFRIPAGNHVNRLRIPGHKPKLKNIIVERTKFAADTDPTVTVRLDDFATAAFLTPSGPNAPVPITQHTSYSELWYDMNRIAGRAQLKITKAANAEKLELQTLAFLWDSPAGA